MQLRLLIFHFRASKKLYTSCWHFVWSNFTWNYLLCLIHNSNFFIWFRFVALPLYMKSSFQSLAANTFLLQSSRTNIQIFSYWLFLTLAFFLFWGQSQTWYFCQMYNAINDWPSTQTVSLVFSKCSIGKLILFVCVGLLSANRMACYGTAMREVMFFFVMRKVWFPNQFAGPSCGKLCSS